MGVNVDSNAPEQRAPRRRVQLQLATCVIVSIVAGLLLLLNARTRMKARSIRADTNSTVVVYVCEATWSSGFPVDMNVYARNTAPLVALPDEGLLQEVLERQEGFEYLGDPQDVEDIKRMAQPPAIWSGEWLLPQVLLNLTVAMAALVAVAAACEFVLRRRA